MRARLIAVFALVVVVMASPGSGPANAAGSALPPAAAARPALAGGIASPGEAFVHLGTVDNSSGNSSYMDNPLLNGHPNAVVFAVNVTHPYPGVPANDEAMGVWYNAPQWAVYNEDENTLSNPLAWNIFIPPPEAVTYVHTTTGANSTLNYTILDNPAFNNQPDAMLFVQHVYNPPAASGNLFTPTVALDYSPGLGRWLLFRPDTGPMPTGITFFVLKPGPADVVFQHTTQTAQVGTFYSDLDHPLLNGNPDALAIIQQNIGAGAAAPSGRRFGLAYHAGTQHWAIFPEDGEPMPNNAMFNVLVVPPKTGYMVLKQNGIGGNSIEIDNPDLDSNPYARIYVMHRENALVPASVIADNHFIGVYYSSFLQHWYLYNRDFVSIAPGTTFNLYYTWPRADSSIVAASSVNTNSLRSMTFNSPLLTNNPSAVPLISHTKEPDGVTTNNDYPFATDVQYLGPLWQFFGGDPLPANLGFNLLAPPASSSFVITATSGLGGNVFGGYLFLDNAQINGNPNALVFASQHANGISLIDANPVGVWFNGFNWTIFPEDNTSIPDGTVFDVFFINRRLEFLPSIYR